MNTKYGEYMKFLRARKCEKMKDTAVLLGVSLPFVSIVESGKKNVPISWLPIIAEHYNLSDNEKKELDYAAQMSKCSIRIGLRKAREYQRRLAIQFERSFKNMDEKTAKEIIELLKENKYDC